jgi:hypothetical protein
MKGAALARAARGWHADARDRALGADLKSEDIVYMFCELVTLLRSSSSLSQNFDHVYVISVRPISALALEHNRRLHREFFVLRDKHLGSQGRQNWSCVRALNVQIVFRARRTSAHR